MFLENNIMKKFGMVSMVPKNTIVMAYFGSFTKFLIKYSILSSKVLSLNCVLEVFSVIEGIRELIIKILALILLSLWRYSKGSFSRATPWELNDEFRFSDYRVEGNQCSFYSPRITQTDVSTEDVPLLRTIR